MDQGYFFGCVYNCCIHKAVQKTKVKGYRKDERASVKNTVGIETSTSSLDHVAKNFPPTSSNNPPAVTENADSIHAITLLNIGDEGYYSLQDQVSHISAEGESPDEEGSAEGEINVQHEHPPFVRAISASKSI